MLRYHKTILQKEKKTLFDGSEKFVDVDLSMRIDVLEKHCSKYQPQRMVYHLIYHFGWPTDTLQKSDIGPYH